MLFTDFIKLLGLEEKPNCTTSIIVSSTGNLCNSITINVEGAQDESELVYKTFDTVEANLNAAKQMAEVGGFPTTAEDFAKSLGLTIAKGKAQK